MAAPTQHDPITLLDRPASVRFSKRDTTQLDVETVTTELGRALVTSIEQTVLDLARKPSLGVAEDQISQALRALLPRCELELLDDLARRQRLRSALERRGLWRDDLPERAAARRSSGADLRVVMDRLGHRQITTTGQYLGSLPEAGERALAAFEAVRSRRH